MRARRKGRKEGGRIVFIPFFMEKANNLSDKVSVTVEGTLFSLEGLRYCIWDGRELDRRRRDMRVGFSHE